MCTSSCALEVSDSHRTFALSGRNFVRSTVEGLFLNALFYELSGLGLIALGVLGVLGNFGSAGLAGVALRRVASWVLGDLWFVLPVGLIALGGFYVVRRGPIGASARKMGIAVLAVTMAAFLHCALPAGHEFENAFRGYGGGLVGALVAWSLVKLFGTVGRFVALAVMFLAGLLLVTNVTIVGGFQKGIRALRRYLRSLRDALVDFIYVFPEDSREDKDERGQEPETPERVPIPEPAPRPEPRREKPRPQPEQRAQSDEPKAYAQMTLDQGLTYQVPPLTLLDRGPKIKAPKSDRDIAEKSRLLEETLDSFDVKAKVVDVRRGPTVTRYEVQPAPGVKVASIVKLANDIALAMASGDVRIEAPIPGKSAVGIEVPNREISVVTLREVLESQEFKNVPSRLAVALGKDIAGKPVVGSLESMVHLLIAGATGSGKSVCINAIIASLLFRAKPDELKMLMIDPKVVELSIYNGIPHLIAPVVTDPSKAAKALQWVLKEMTRRYEAFAAIGVRDISKFNDHVATALGKPWHMALPYIVVVIDELADLMVVAPVDVEDAIFRLAQMARAAGIHLVVATQRPSVDVITGTIKANIQSRIAFAVASQIDSRTILDSAGAEKLLGRGDMLFFPVGAQKPLRAQGAYISEEEIEDIVKFVSSQAEPTFEEAILKAEVGEQQTSGDTDDELFPQAVRIIVEAGQASVSLLQRRLPIGYTRAARLIDVMEQRGYIGPYEGSKPREVFLTFEEYNRIFGITA